MYVYAGAKALYTHVTNSIVMTKVTIKVDGDTHKALIMLVSKKQIEKGKRVTIDEVINDLINMKK